MMMSYRYIKMTDRALFSTASHPIKKVAVVGMGLMGHGVVQYK